MKEALSERLKEQQEMERKLAKIAKQLDHLERARREEEIPYLEAAYKARLEQDKQLHEEQQAQFLTAHRAAWEVDIQVRCWHRCMLAGRAVRGGSGQAAARGVALLTAHRAAWEVDVQVRCWWLRSD